jgi:uncharacterized protein
VNKTDPPSFDCAKAATRVERLICQDVGLSFLDSQMAKSYQMELKGASADRKEMIRRQQAEWFADYGRTCNAPLSDTQRRDCIDRCLSDRPGESRDAPRNDSPIVGPVLLRSLVPRPVFAIHFVL